MNDPGLDEPIRNDAKTVEEESPNNEKDEADDDQAFLTPRLVLKSPSRSS